MSGDSLKRRKIAVLGSRSNHFVDAYYPTIENTFAKTVTYKGVEYDCHIIDTAGQDEYSPVNAQHAIGIHGYVLVYSITSRASFDMIQIVYDKIIDFCGVTDIPCVIVGSKCDLRQKYGVPRVPLVVCLWFHSHSRQVQLHEGQKLAKDLGAVWVETSAKENLRVETGPSSSRPSASNDRGLWGVIWGCITTIFACTWIAIHPNIPAPSERPIARKLKIFVLALIAPELIVLWALRQWLSSRKLARKYKGLINKLSWGCGYSADPLIRPDYGWTQTHGFFAIMGGFQIYNESDTSKRVRPLDPDDIEPYLKTHVIDISEEDILDRSKGDALAKSLAVIQVTWFILQVAARAVQHLAITELEVVTLAFAILNFMTYFCWWNKPLDVNYGIRIAAFHTYSPHDSLATLTLLRRPSSVSISIGDGHEENRNPWSVSVTFGCGTESDISPSIIHPIELAVDGESNSPHYSLGRSSDLHLPRTPLPLPSAAKIAVTPNRARLAREYPSPSFKFVLPPPSPDVHALADGNHVGHGGVAKGNVAHTARSACCRIWSAFTNICKKCLILASLPFWKAIVVIFGFFNTCVDKSTREFSKLVVRGTFHCAYSFGTLSKAENTTADSLACGVAVIFGAIHCLAWYFEFPTKTEALLWRIYSTAITILPIYAMILPRLRNIIFPPPSYTGHLQHLQLRTWLAYNFYIPSFRISKSLYIVGRIVLLVQMFVLLRNPAPGIYTPVDWVSYIPHL
ncbi:hypothetical protein C0991_001135 [Blastosporella zonata]|nr:hypothetical protein C0991_001135 [Blastosporella zonata]